MRQDDIPKLVNTTLSKALSENASDIYVLPYEEECYIRFRTKGVQQNELTLGREDGLQFISRIKVIAGLLTYVTKSAQDGAFDYEGSSIRCSSMPTIHGERLTLRILNSSNNFDDLEDLGFSDESVKAIRQMIESRQGMTLLTGATGSGKTTLMYSLVNEIMKTEPDNSSIISLEDPVEKLLNGISQVEINHDLSYQSALKASLRQNIKTLFIGELRDKEVVNVALDAALSGHRIISTYHAGDIVSIFSRLLHTGYEPFLVASAINGCISLTLDYDHSNNFYKPSAECFVVDDEWRDIIMKKPGITELRKLISSRLVT